MPNFFGSGRAGSGLKNSGNFGSKSSFFSPIFQNFPKLLFKTAFIDLFHADYKTNKSFWLWNGRFWTYFNSEIGFYRVKLEIFGYGSGRVICCLKFSGRVRVGHFVLFTSGRVNFGSGNYPQHPYLSLSWTRGFPSWSVQDSRQSVTPNIGLIFTFQISNLQRNEYLPSISYFCFCRIQLILVPTNFVRNHLKIKTSDWQFQWPKITWMSMYVILKLPYFSLFFTTKESVSFGDGQSFCRLYIR